MLKIALNIIPKNIPIKELIDVRYPSPSLYNVPETHPPAITIPKPNKSPPTMVDIPTGNT